MAFWSTIVSILYYLFLVAVVILTGLVTSVIVYVKYVHFKYRHIPAPKKTGFIFGHYKFISEWQRTNQEAFSHLLFELYEELGTIFVLLVIHRPLVCVLDAGFVKELLTNSKHVKPQFSYSKFHSVFGARLAGNGLVSELDHARWKRKRNLINPAFHRQYLMGLINEFNVSADKLIDHLIPSANGEKEVSMLSEFNSVTLDIIARVGFAMDLNVIEDPDCPFPRAASLVLKGIIETVRIPWLWLKPTAEAASFRRDVRQAANLLRKTARDCITERIAAKQRGDDLPRDILTYILEASDNLSADHDFGMEEMMDEFVTFFVAGQETTSNLLAFTIQQLSRFPDVLDRVTAEIDEVLGSKPFVSYEDIMKLEYMMLVLKETMRLFPPVAGTSRVIFRDMDFEGYTIPKGTQVLVSHLSMGKMDRYFDNPQEFRPERFQLKGDEKPRHMYAYFPFSLGQRSCIGQQFALIETRVILAKLLRKFNFKLVPGQRFAMRDEITCKPYDGCMTYITLIQ